MIEKIRNFEFENLNQKEVIINPTIKKIGVGAFANSAIESIVIPSSVEHISRAAFRNCRNLKSVIFKTDNCRVCSGAFINCENLKTVENFPNTEIHEDVFKNCISLSNITFANEDIEFIGANAFYNCASLKEITLSSELTFIGEEAFAECEKLEKINVKPNNKLSYINSYAFKHCVSLQSVDFSPANIDCVAIFAFEDCKNLFEITFDNVKRIYDNVFDGCGALSRIIIPEKVCKENEYFYTKYKDKIINSKSLEALIDSGKSFREISKIYKGEINVK